jgi:hypothetical protein
MGRVNTKEYVNVGDRQFCIATLCCDLNHRAPIVASLNVWIEDRISILGYREPIQR